ncbi:hypothetical protein ABT298_01185 [Streptomyces sp. NPDC001034]|uniref:hypothetical protein n=1 Tax=Streptomyces sp. NPDC001034 TaxID=3154375 RepID=UPI00332AA610
MRLRPVSLLGCALAPALLLTACTSHHDPAPGHRPSPPAAHRSGGAEDEKKLTDQAQSALDAVTDHGSSMVESGVERVPDGVHTRPGPAHGTAYELTVVCAGKGTAEIVVAPSGAGRKKAVPCDGSAVVERLAATGPLKVDIQGEPGAAGMIAWRINRA